MKQSTSVAHEDLLCCPECKSTLKPAWRAVEPARTLACPRCNKTYPTHKGIVQFIEKGDVPRFSRRMELMRAVYAAFYTPLTDLLMATLCGGRRHARQEILESLELTPGARILETGIGPGDNIAALGGRLEGCTYYGIDNQMRMLVPCSRRSRRWKQDVRLYYSNAEALPFRDQSFDAVFHVGSINLFANQRRAIDEMIRVARNGTRIVIADESEAGSKMFAVFSGTQPPVVPPIHLVHESMEEKQLRTIWRGYGYMITFRKPRAPQAISARSFPPATPPHPPTRRTPAHASLQGVSPGRPLTRNLGHA